MTTAAITLTAGPAISGTAQATTNVTRTVNAAVQSTGLGCSETRLASAVAFENRALLGMRCLGRLNNNANRYIVGFTPTSRTLYLATKFYNATTRRWRIAITRRMT